jgi:hypothetical protein
MPAPLRTCELVFAQVERGRCKRDLGCFGSHFRPGWLPRFHIKAGSLETRGLQCRRFQPAFRLQIPNGTREMGIVAGDRIDRPPRSGRQLGGCRWRILQHRRHLGFVPPRTGSLLIDIAHAAATREGQQGASKKRHRGRTQRCMHGGRTPPILECATCFLGEKKESRKSPRCLA